MLNSVKDVLYKRFDQDWLVSKVDFLDGILKFAKYVMLAEVKTLLRNMGMHPDVDVDISMLDGVFEDRGILVKMNGFRNCSPITKIIS